ncbi:HupE/UreJ family protein [bacterium]|nr:HupE/UreJ family protein [bacterium]MBU1993447.1 HupE/UreJ family protein [bacterium]
MLHFRIFVFLFFCVLSLSAHQSGLSYVEIQEDENKNIDVIYKKPIEDSKAKDIFINFGTHCMKVEVAATAIADGFVTEKFSLWCGEDGLKNSRIWVEGLVSSDRGVLIRYANDSLVEKALLLSSTPFMRISHTDSKYKVFADYVKLGIIHILMGFDHLLFVLSLILLVKNLKILLYTITAFTLSHSITLAVGIFGFVNIAPLYIEAMIALSIVFLARELLVGASDSFTKRKLGFVSFVFGLLHGFGFSGVLSNIGLPQNEIPLSLFSFNVGIEIGQLIFIIFVGILFYLQKRFASNIIDKNSKIIPYSIGTLSAFWLIERLVSF